MLKLMHRFGLIGQVLAQRIFDEADVLVRLLLYVGENFGPFGRIILQKDRPEVVFPDGGAKFLLVGTVDNGEKGGINGWLEYHGYGF